MRPLLLLWLAACNGGDADGTEPTGDTDDSLLTETGAFADTGDTGSVDTFCDEAPQITWENFGAGFVTENCQACHASTAPERQGAPPDVTFDDEAQVLERADAVLTWVVDLGAMPPQGGVSEDDRYLVEVWLGCE